MERLLVHGYVRSVEQFLSDQIIPIDIYHICFDFYFSTKFIFYLASIKNADEEPSLLNTMSVINTDSKQQWNCNVTRLFNANIDVLAPKRVSTDWIIDNAAICFARNVKLPSRVHTALKSLHLHTPSKFNYVVFQCGGTRHLIGQKNEDQPVNDCGALIIDSHEFQLQNATHIHARHWKLPAFPHAITSNYALYSSVHRALFSLGGGTDDSGQEDTQYDTIHKLCFADCDRYPDENEWSWQQLPMKMDQRKSGVCATFLDSAHNKLMIAGGWVTTGVTTVEIFDLLSNKTVENVSALKKGRMDAGIFYDSISNVCYVGGGYNYETTAADVQSSVECYDCVKNVWSPLPNTLCDHDMNPLLWMEEGNVLHIMSIIGNCIECVDLRQGVWMLKSGELEKAFNVKFDSDNVTCSRIVGNY